MKLLLDASMSPAVGDALRALKFDVVNHRDVLRANASDLEVLAEAWPDRRIVIARDYDMGELVLRGFAQAEGVIIVAFDFEDAVAEARRIAMEIRSLGERVRKAVTVIEAAGVRSRPYDIAHG